MTALKSLTNLIAEYPACRPVRVVARTRRSAHTKAVGDETPEPEVALRRRFGGNSDECADHYRVPVSLAAQGLEDLAHRTPMNEAKLT